MSIQLGVVAGGDPLLRRHKWGRFYCNRNECQYQATSASPQKKAAMAAMDRKGPKGMGSLRPLTPERSKRPPTSPPPRNEIKRARRDRGKPVARPTRAASFTSPPPIPSG